jgi:hypothetical protein
MERKKIIIILAIVALLLMTLFPVPASAAGTVKWNVKNASTEKVTIRLWGPASYTLEAKKNGPSKFDVVPGTYNYSMRVCGTNMTGEIVIGRTSKPFKIPKCATLIVNNQTGGGMTIQLTGPANYNLSFGTGKTSQSVLSGSYSYTAYGCGGSSMSGKIALKGKKNWSFWCY